MSPYRESEPIKVETSFSYIERHYMSGSRLKKIWANTLMLGLDIAKLLGIITIISAVITALIGIFWLISKLLTYIGEKLHTPLPNLIFVGGAMIFIFVIIIGVTREAYKENRKSIELRIKRKLELSQTPITELPLAESEEEHSLILSRIQDEVNYIAEEVKRIHS